MIFKEAVKLRALTKELEKEIASKSCGGYLMMTKETEKLKSLTEKLKKEGDITENEADWIYLFRKIYIAVFISYNFIFAKSDGSVKFTSEILKNFPTATELKGEDLSRAFSEWYRVVEEYIKAGKSGNFLSTIPKEFNVREYKYGMWHERKTGELLKHLANALGPADVPENFSGRILSCDMEDRAGKRVFNRYGLEQRPEGESKDIDFLSRMVQKLDDEGDISEGESDLIYMLVKYACVIYTDSIDGPGKNTGLEKLRGALESWYKTVYKHVKSGKTGNFLYTLPINSKISLGNARRYISLSLSMLPKECDQMIFFGTPPKPDCFLLDSFFSSVIVYPGGPRSEAISYRWGSMKRAGVIPDRHVKVDDPSGRSFFWLELSREKLVRIAGFETENGKCCGIVTKLEYLKKRGLKPLAAALTNEPDRGAIFFDEKTYKKAKPVLDIPDEKVEKLSPGLYDFEINEIMRKMEPVIEDLIVENMKAQEQDPEDDWLDSVR